MDNLAKKDLINELDVSFSNEYDLILKKINDVFPLAKKDTENFNKASSQFKVATLDVTELTSINSAKHLLAIAQQTRLALEETLITLRRKKVELKYKLIETEQVNGKEKEILLIDIDE
jgi:hypothetical protein